jgi:hypothetical protein
MNDKARIKLNDDISFEIIDPDNIRPVYADLVTELRVIQGVLHLSLATICIEGDDAGTTFNARICARLRIGANTLQFIQNALTTPSTTKIPPGQTIN